MNLKSLHDLNHELQKSLGKEDMNEIREDLIAMLIEHAAIMRKKMKEREDEFRCHCGNCS